MSLSLLQLLASDYLCPHLLRYWNMDNLYHPPNAVVRPALLDDNVEMLYNIPAAMGKEKHYAS